MTHFLGLDAGGTKIRWRCIGDDAKSLALGEAPGAQPAVVGVARAGEAFASLIAELHAKFTPALTIAGVAGAGSVTVKRGLVDALRTHGVTAPVVFCGDPEVAAAAALADAPGAAVWAGTGSFAIARGQSGTLLRVGGRGYLLGDRGGAYAIARASAIAALEALDGIGPATELGAGWVDALQLARLEDIGAAMQALAPRDVAARAELVFATAAAGDAVAQRVLDDEARHLTALVVEVARRAGVSTQRVIGGGGVLARFPAFGAALARQLRGTIVPPPRDEAEGAALLARAVHLGQQPLAGWLS